MWVGGVGGGQWPLTISLEASSWIGPQGPQGGVEETEDTLPPEAHQPTEEESFKDINHRTERTGKGALATESLPARKQDAQYYLI